MTREEAYTLLTKYLTNKNLIKHSLACEVGMQALARKFQASNPKSQIDENEWGITGLLHDIDYEVAQKENLLDKHGILLFERNEITLPEKIAYAIQAHNFHSTNIQPKSHMDWAIVCVDRLTGLIVAAALVLPDKKISSLTAESVLKRFREKSFAKGASRESIQLCEEKLGIPLPEFIDITLKSMQSINDSLGL